MNNHKFDVNKLEKLNNPDRIKLVNLDKLIGELNLPSKSTIVDIGAGTGVFVEAILKKLPEAKGYGFDISKEMIDWMEENRVPNFDGRLEVGIMDESNIPMMDNSADLVFMITVHHELDNAKALLKDVKRVLKDSGKILICDWKEWEHKHFVTKTSIIEDINSMGFTKVREIEASDKLVCLIGSE